MEFLTRRRPIRILLANNRYFPSGGPERYLFTIEAGLRQAGHEVFPFALAYPQSEPAETRAYFPPPPVEGDFLLYGDRPLSLGEKLSLAWRVVNDRAVYRAAREALRALKIDVVYALQIAHYLFPEVLLAARDENVPVVMRLSDYQLVCPAYNCLRDEKPCFLCRDGFLPALTHRCLKKSLPITAVRVAAMLRARWAGALDAVRYFIAPSRFLIGLLRQAGFAPHRLLHLPTPIELTPDPGPAHSDAPLLYVGGLYEAKGAHLAIEALRGTGRALLIAGDTNTPYGRRLVEKVEQERISEVRFLGFVRGEVLARLYAAAQAVLVPSIWWENVPHVALEAMAYRRPVIAGDLGSLPEVVAHGETGLLFAPGDPLALRARVEELARSGLVERYGDAGRARAAAEHDPQRHRRRLEEIFAECRR